MDINWFPGHMAKALRLLQDQLARADFVLELCDARLPESSRNPELQKLLGHKASLLILNKADLSDPDINREWLSYYQAQGRESIFLNAHKSQDLKACLNRIQILNRPLLERAKARGRLIRPIRCMVVGIPNCGKSTLINGLCGKKAAATANRPGLTRSISWLRAGQDLELMDSPGVLWPKLATPEEQLHLAASNAIRDEVLPLTDLASFLFCKLAQDYAQALNKSYGFCPDLPNSVLAAEQKLSIGQEALRELAERKRLLSAGADPDIMRSAKRFLSDFREGKLGRISLERPDTLPAPMTELPS